MVKGLRSGGLLFVAWQKEVMSSLSPSGAVVFLPVPASVARSHASLADVLRRTARVMAALRRRKGIWISCFHLCWRAFADI